MLIEEQGLRRSQIKIEDIFLLMENLTIIIFGDMVSIDNGTLAVGVEREDSNQNTITNSDTASSNNINFNSGAVYVYSFFKK